MINNENIASRIFEEERSSVEMGNKFVKNSLQGTQISKHFDLKLYVCIKFLLKNRKG